MRLKRLLHVAHLSFHRTKNLSKLRAETILISNFLMFSCIFLLSIEIDDRFTQFVKATWFDSPQKLTPSSQLLEGPGFWRFTSYSLFGPLRLLSFFLVLFTYRRSVLVSVLRHRPQKMVHYLKKEQ